MPTVEFILNERPDPVITIPAAHPDVGPLMIWFANEEIAVGVGEHYHCHFDLFRCEPKEPTKDLALIHEPLPGFSLSSMTGSWLEIHRVDGEYAGGATYPTSAVGVTKIRGEAKLYTWSGPWEWRT